MSRSVRIIDRPLPHDKAVALMSKAGYNQNSNVLYITDKH